MLEGILTKRGGGSPTKSDLLPDLKIPVSMPRDQLKNTLCNYPAKLNTPKHRGPVPGL